MKKLLILVIALALVGGVAMAQVTLSGQVELGFQNSFEEEGDTPDADIVDSGLDARLQVNANVDQYNSATIRFRFNPAKVFDGDVDDLLAGTGDADDFASIYNASIDRAHFTTDLGALAGTDAMGLGIKTNIGWNEFSYANVAEITGYELEGLGVGDFTDLGTKFSFDIMGMANAYLALGLAEQDINNGTGDLKTRTLLGLDTAIDVGVGTAVAEFVYYYAPGLGAGHVGIAGGLVDFMATPDVGLGFTASVTLPLANEGSDLEDGIVDPEFIYGVGVTADYAGLANLGISFRGQDDAAAEALGINVGVTPLDFLSLDLGFAIALEDEYFGYGEEAFNSLDASLTVSAGAADFTFGYFFLNKYDAGGADDVYVNAIGDLNAVSSDFSGLYINAILSF